MLFLIDDRYPDVDAVGEAIRAVLPLPFERRSSDYLGGDYLLCRTSEGAVVQVRRNYSSYLDEWYVEGSKDKYVMLVQRWPDASVFDALCHLPGFRRKAS